MSKSYLLIIIVVFLQCSEKSIESKLEENTKKLQLVETNIRYLYQQINDEELELVKLTVKAKDSASRALADKQRIKMDSLKKEMVMASGKADSLREEIAVLNKSLYEKK
jgi:23S rRNA pseudoU1915 N3-methylase RlmH